MTATAEATRPTRPTRHWRLPHVPALDGLRGLAVAGVLLYHFGYLTGGYLGVDLFFVLSGYLITSLLLVEGAATRTLDLGRFWARRARRLLPALFLLLLGVVVYCELWARPVDLGQIRGDGLAALVYVSNWRTIAGHTSYWDIALAPSPLQHLWSLAIEEQFYLVWPLVVLGLVRGRTGEAGARRVLVIAAGGAAISLGLFATLHAAGVSDTRLYEGTDTRAFALLAGAIVACWRRLEAGEHPPLAGRVGPALRAVAPLAALVLGAAWIWLDGTSTLLYAGGLPACSALAAVVIGALVAPGGGVPVLGEVVGWRPIRLLGTISYGLYLWHWPVSLVVNEVRVGFGGPALLALRWAVSLALAAFSYVVVEHPIRTGALQGWLARAAIPAAMALLAVSLLAATSDAVAVTDVNAVNARREPLRVLPGAPKLLYVGDSVAGSLADYPVSDPATFGVNAYNAAVVGCGLMYEGFDVKGQGGEVTDPPPCTPAWPRWVAERRPDVVLVLFGASPVAQPRIDGAFRHACEPEYDSVLHDRLADQVRALSRAGTTIVLVTNPPSTNPFRDPHADEYVGCVNEVVAAVGAETPAEVADLAGFVCPDGDCRDEFDGEPTRPDSVHFDGPGGAPAARWLIDRALDLARIAH